MNGYCGDCDEQIEFHEGTIEKKYDSLENVIFVYLKCPWCNELETITKIQI